MKQIILDSVCIEGFRSYTEPTIISFTDTPGLKFISGDNQVEPSLESNGAGKSTVFDAIVWCLYGFSVKGLRASDLMSRGAKRMQVMVILVIDGETVAIERTSPPNRLTVDGKVVEQWELDRQIVGLSRDRCLNSVVFGQSVPLFIDRSLPERGDLLDDVLNLAVWLHAADVATKRHRDRERELSQLMLQVERLNGQLAGLPDVNELQEQEEEWDADRDARLRHLIDRYEAVETELEKMRVPVLKDDNQINLSLTASRAALTEKERERAVIQTKLDRIIDDVNWLQDNETCPMCNQKIDKGFRQAHIAHHNNEAAKLEKIRKEVIQAIDTNRAEITTLEEQRQSEIEIRQQRAVVVEQYNAKKRESNDLQQQAIRTRNEKNPYTAQRQTVDAEQRRLSVELDAKQVDAAVLTKYLSQLDFWKQGFRRCRLFCLDQVLRELTLETRNSLVALGLQEWSVNYTTATETKSGTVKLGVQIEVVPPGEQAGNFNVLSGGEGQRVRLAASLGLANLVQRWAGVRWNFEIWDEPTAWLSTRGVENLLEALVYRAQMQGKSILLADHRSLAHSSFAESYRVTKDQQGSHWERV